VERTPENVRAEFCAVLKMLRRLTRGVAQRQRRVELERIVLAARRGEDVTPLLAAVGWADSAGASHRSSEFTAPTTLGSLGGGKPVTGGYVCPDGSCSRVERRAPGEGPPECLIQEKILRFVAES
jgi:hypothetical protein